MSVQPSVCPPGISRLSLDEFSWSSLYENFSKIWKKCECYWNNEYFKWGPTCIYYNILVYSYQNEKFFRQRNSEHIFCFQQIFFEICAVYEIMWKNTAAPKKAMDDNITWRRRAKPCMLDNKGYRHTFRICNTFYNSLPKIVTRKRLNGTLISALFCFSVMC